MMHVWMEMEMEMEERVRVRLEGVELLSSRVGVREMQLQTLHSRSLVISRLHENFLMHSNFHALDRELFDYL